MASIDELARDISNDVDVLVRDIQSTDQLTKFSEVIKKESNKIGELVDALMQKPGGSATVLSEVSAQAQKSLDTMRMTFETDPLWAARPEKDRATALEAAEAYFKRHTTRVPMEPEALAVDSRVHKVLQALSFLNVKQFGMKEGVVNALTENVGHFDQAVQALESMQAATESGRSPRDRLRHLACFYSHLVAVIRDAGFDGSADEIMDLAMYTLKKVCPHNLYSTLRYIKLFRWHVAASSGITDFLLLWLESLTANICTLNTTHFAKCDPDVFLANMMEAGFEAAEFQPRPPGTALPPPFSTGPPVGSHLSPPKSPAPTSAPATEQTIPVNSRQPRTPPAASASGSTSSTPTSSPRATGQPASATASGKMPASVAELEKLGAERLHSARSLHRMHKAYPFLRLQSQDVFVKDIGDLLSAYQDLAIKYESLRMGLAKAGLR